MTIDNLIMERNIESFMTLRTKPSKRRKHNTSNTAYVPEVINNIGLSQALTKYRIYIDERVSHLDKLVAIAQGMGSTVVPSSDTSNIVILEPRNADRYKMSVRYQKKGLKCAPPAWLFTCYEQNQHIPISHFPFDVKQDQPTLTPIPIADNDDDNPFGLDPVDYDELEENMPGKQTTIDRYLAETHPQHQEQHHYQEEEEDEVQEDEQEEMEQEVYYNRRHETPEESQERKRAASERMRSLLQDAENMIRNKNSIARRTKRVERKVVPPVEDWKEMKVWYGEQPITNNINKSRK
ncbi:hypothetical protein INT47_009214 [Mucor saturninus]|uniref:BRCT domain-containing protein n=1 Tax=Mucor saturninus TaxID=64648 RepID=A0A8H7RN73_9FUNG|nr:hypothetical protein INT47_009214 [Mucor saturninus]